MVETEEEEGEVGHLVVMMVTSLVFICKFFPAEYVIELCKLVTLCSIMLIRCCCCCCYVCCCRVSTRKNHASKYFQNLFVFLKKECSGKSILSNLLTNEL